MKSTSEKLNVLRDALKQRKARIMIIGLGSVGNYLLDYLMSAADEGIEICVTGRNEAKLQSDVNIVRVASMIRGQNRSTIRTIGDVDLTHVTDITRAIKEYGPDIIVNSSRAYPGLKYGSISWANVRAYGIWSPLAIRFTKNIMEAYEEADSDAIVINTSYSDAVIPWLKSAGKAYPDFGSGNINHLLPRIKFALAREKDIDDYWNIDVTFAVSHFHDVVISKEGHSQGVEMLIDIRYRGEKLSVDMDRILSMCSIPMPVDAKRNQMNASSNYEIIRAVLGAVRDGKKFKLHCPGVFGEIGGYPLIVDGRGERVEAHICEDYFSIDEMRKKNRESIYLDGIEKVENGTLTYTDELLAKVKKAFGVDLVKQVSFEDIDKVASFIISEIIEKNVQ
ncbi:MAG: hypothetical protein K5989_05145 [Lachnospiraceae bacterium]|nr:hypothetical protein [Lachnospiraceae bacterium]